MIFIIMILFYQCQTICPLTMKWSYGCPALGINCPFWNYYVIDSPWMLIIYEFSILLFVIIKSFTYETNTPALFNCAWRCVLFFIVVGMVSVSGNLFMLRVSGNTSC